MPGDTADESSQGSPVDSDHDGPPRSLLIAALAIGVVAVGTVLVIAATRHPPTAPVAIASVPSPGAQTPECQALLATLPDGAVLCSHGDVIPDTLAALERRGCRFAGPVEWRKGSVWTLERVGDDIVAAEMWLPTD